jgi:hypothetical protein
MVGSRRWAIVGVVLLLGTPALSTAAVADPAASEREGEKPGLARSTRPTWT